MSALWVIAATVFTFLMATTMTVLSDMISEEVRSRLDGLPRTLVRIAARIVPERYRADCEGDWLGVLDEILHGSESRPITRLIQGSRFALSLMFGAWQVRREVRKSMFSSFSLVLFIHMLFVIIPLEFGVIFAVVRGDVFRSFPAPWGQIMELTALIVSIPAAIVVGSYAAIFICGMLAWRAEVAMSSASKV